LALLAVASSALPAHADTSQEKFWTDYIEACSPGTQLNGHAHLIGPTNPIGPGSVWGMAGKTTNLIATEKTYLGDPNAAGQFSDVVYPPAPANCSALGGRKWDLTLGVPVTLAPGNAADLALALKNAKDITVSIDSVEIVSIPIATWEDQANKISHESAAYTDAVDGKHYLMSAAYAVKGLTVKYTLDSSVSASLKANIQASKVVSVGTAGNPVTAQVDISNDGQVITLKTTGSSYVLGQFLTIQKVKPKDQLATLLSTPDAPKTSPKQPAPQSKIKVNSRPQ